MTEHEWLFCTHPDPMLNFLRDKASDRKMRLFAVACCRRIWNLLDDDLYMDMVNTSERYADGDEVAGELNDLWNMAVEYGALDDPPDYSRRAPLYAIEWHRERSLLATNTATAVAYAVAYNDLGLNGDRLAMERQEQTRLLRCIFGNPFRPVTLDPAWLTPTVQSLAKATYETRDFTRLPILADALEDAGCDNQDILSHCRQSGEHCRGCWALDLVLDRK